MRSLNFSPVFWPPSRTYNLAGFVVYWLLLAGLSLLFLGRKDI